MDIFLFIEGLLYFMSNIYHWRGDCMDKEISNNYQYPEHLAIQDGIEKTELYVIKITKEQVDRLIEDIDQTLKASTWRLFLMGLHH